MWMRKDAIAISARTDGAKMTTGSFQGKMIAGLGK